MGFALGAKATLQLISTTGKVTQAAIAIFCPLLFCGLLVALTGRRWSGLAVFLLAVAVACPWAWLHWQASWQTYLSKLPRRECWGKVRCRLQEGGFDSQRLSVLSAVRPRMVGKVTEIQTMASPNEWQRARGRVLLRGDKDMLSDLHALLAGEEIEAEGMFLFPPQGEEMYGFYGDYLRSLGIRRIFLVRDLQARGLGSGWDCRWRRGIARLRQRLAELLVADIDEPQVGGMFLALGLGLRGYLPKTSQEAFLKSGTIHLFAISGLHVTFVSAFCLQTLVLLGIPLRPRLVLAGAICLGYALLTGLSPSSCRAALMVLLWIYAQLRWRPSNSIHILSLTGNLSLLVNPLLVLNTGFLYSYLAVVILLVTWTAGNRFSIVLFEKKHWVPVRLQGWRPLRQTMERLGLHDLWARWRLWREKLPTALLSSCLVWLGTSGLTASHGRWLCLATPFLNLPLAFILPWVLGSCPLKIICALCWPRGNRWLAQMVTFLLKLLQALAEAPRTLPVRAPSNLGTILFYLALAVLVLCLNRGNRK